MKNDPKRLTIVKKVFARREQEEARRLSEFQADLNESIALLKQLRDYRDRNTATLRSTLSTDPGSMQNLQAFHGRLNEAISQQEQLIQRAELERDELRRKWLARRRKTQSVGKLSNLWAEQNEAEELVREQKLQDDLVQANFTRSTDNSCP